LVHIDSNRVVESVISPRSSGPGSWARPFGPAIGCNVDVKVVEPGMNLVQIIGRYAVRQQDVDIVAGDAALLVSQKD